MGELEDASIEEAIMPHITSANVACGAHAGSAGIMQRTIALALQYGVAIGAHPGYPDRQNFGRVELHLSPKEIAATVYAQIVTLDQICSQIRCQMCEQVSGAGASACQLSHVKPHGALYNVAAKNPEVANAIADGVARWNPSTILVGLAGSQALEVWQERGFQVAAEAFADRGYEPDGSLRPRTQPGALLTDPGEAAKQALTLVRQGRAQTLCIHSDTPGAAATVRQVAQALKSAGIVLRSLGAEPRDIR